MLALEAEDGVIGKTKVREHSWLTVVKIYIFTVETVMLLYYSCPVYLEASEIWYPREPSSLTVDSLLLRPLRARIFTFLFFYSFFEDFLYCILFIFALPVTSTISTPINFVFSSFFFHQLSSPIWAAHIFLDGWSSADELNRGNALQQSPHLFPSSCQLPREPQLEQDFKSAFPSLFWDWVWLELARRLSMLSHLAPLLWSQGVLSLYSDTHCFWLFLLSFLQWFPSLGGRGCDRDVSFKGDHSTVSILCDFHQHFELWE